jgi:hypothetical protein
MIAPMSTRKNFAIISPNLYRLDANNGNNLDDGLGNGEITYVDE